VVYNKRKEEKKRKRKKRKELWQKGRKRYIKLSFDTYYRGDHNEEIRDVFANLFKDNENNPQFGDFIEECQKSTETIFELRPEFVLCNTLYNSFPDWFFKKYFTTYKMYYWIKFLKRTLEIYIKSTKTMKTDYGSVIYTNRLVSNRLRVAFCKHFIQRLTERMGVEDQSKYYNYKAIFGVIADSLSVKINDIEINDRTFLQVWMEATPRFHSYEYARNILTTEPQPNSHILLGYCPTVSFANIILAKTLISPGYRGTPERRAYERKIGPLPYAGIEDKCSLHISYENDDFSLLREFHALGFPQVKQIRD
jgi:hypothetical protein